MLKLNFYLMRRLAPTRSLRILSTASFQNVALNDKSDGPSVEVNKVRPTAGMPITNQLVAAAFASLKQEEILSKGHLEEKPSSYTDIWIQIEKEISSANDLNTLLIIASKHPVLSRTHALKIVSTLADWSSSNRVRLSDFESDPRFLKVCRILSRHRAGAITDGVDSVDDLNVIFSVTGDDEATRLITALKLPQMVKVMSALAQKKRRSTPLLRCLAYNITKHPDNMGLKKCADLLYAMATLNFPDDVLMDRICNDIVMHLPMNTDKSPVIGSIATSFGILRYKDTQMLDTLANWVVEHYECCRPYDIASLMITFATLGHHPNNEEFFEKISANLNEKELSKASMWLDVVWSLSILGDVTTNQISSVLSSDFLEKLIGENADLSIATKKKLIQIESYAKLAHPSYKGPFLQTDMGENLPLVYSRDKELFVTSILDTFKNLLSSDSFIKKKCNPKMGFLYDGECALDEKCNPLPLNTDLSKTGKKVFHIALMALDYHDLCKKTFEPIGAIKLYQKLLEYKGYRVLLVPYTEFNPKDKLVNRVQYLERRLKEIVLGKPS